MPESPRGIRNATSEAPLFYLNMSEKKLPLVKFIWWMAGARGEPQARRGGAAIKKQ